MIATVSFLAILFIGVFVSMGHARGPYNNTDFTRNYNQNTTKMPSDCNTNITCNACKRVSKNKSNVIIDPITTVPILQDVPRPQVQKRFQPQVQKKVQKKPKQEKPTTYLRNGYYSQPILKTHLRGSPLVKNLAAYNPPNRYCYSIMSSIKSIVGI